MSGAYTTVVPPARPTIPVPDTGINAMAAAIRANGGLGVVHPVAAALPPTVAPAQPPAVPTLTPTQPPVPQPAQATPTAAASAPTPQPTLDLKALEQSGLSRSTSVGGVNVTQPHVWAQSGFTGKTDSQMAAPAPIANPVAVPDFSGQMKALSDSFAAAQATLAAGKSAPGYKMGDLTRAMMQANTAQQGMGALSKSAADVFGSGASTAASMNNANTAANATVNSANITSDGRIAVAGVNGEYGIRQQQVAADKALQVENVKATAKANSAENAKTLAEAQWINDKTVAARNLPVNAQPNAYFGDGFGVGVHSVPEGSSLYVVDKATGTTLTQREAAKLAEMNKTKK